MENQQIPQFVMELSEIEGITVSDGLNYCGTYKDFDKFLEAFYMDIEPKSSELVDAYTRGDVAFFTIKVHALKTSARMIGAADLSKMALDLEMAGKSGDLAYIDAHLDEFIQFYKSYKYRLVDYMTEKQKYMAFKKPITEDELEDAFDALREVCPSMDYDAMEMILEELRKYKLPEIQQDKVNTIESLFKKLEWDKIESILAC